MKKDWVITAKGIGIILVVLGHVIRGLQAKTLLKGEFFVFVDDIIYSFHMPLFFLISGFFIKQSLSKYRKKDILINKLKTLMYPYFIWSVFQILVNVILSNYTNNSVSLLAIIKLFYLPIAPFWYLYSLFIMYVLAVFTKNISTKVNLVFAIILYILPNTGILLLENLFDFYIYFVIGTFVYNRLEEFNNNMVAILVLFLLFSLSFYCFKYVLSINTIRLYFIPGLTGAVTIFSVSKIISQNKLLKYLGNESLGVFLIHIFFTAGTRIVLFNLFKIKSIELHLVLGLIFGLLGPVLFLYYYRKLNLKGLFIYPV